jgi:hypothetical protein
VFGASSKCSVDTAPKNDGRFQPFFNQLFLHGIFCPFFAVVLSDLQEEFNYYIRIRKMHIADSSALFEFVMHDYCIWCAQFVVCVYVRLSKSPSGMPLVPLSASRCPGR